MCWHLSSVGTTLVLALLGCWHCGVLALGSVGTHRMLAPRSIGTHIMLARRSIGTHRMLARRSIGKHIMLARRSIGTHIMLARTEWWSLRSAGTNRVLALAECWRCGVLTSKAEGIWHQVRHEEAKAEISRVAVLANEREAKIAALEAEVDKVGPCVARRHCERP